MSRSSILRCVSLPGVYPFALYVSTVLAGLNVSVADFYLPSSNRSSIHGAVGYVANGTVDTWTEPRFLAADTYEHVAYATPFIQSTLHALIKRRSPSVNFASVTANVPTSIWLTIGACMALILIVCHMNPSGNTLWDHVHSMMPGSNSRPIPIECGAATKLLIIVWGVTIFTAFTIYQAMLLNSLMIEAPPTALTYDQIADMILDDELQVILKFDSSVLHRENSTRLDRLQHAFRTKPFRQISNESDVLDAVLHERGVYFQRPSRIYPLFRHAPASICKEFEVVTFGDDAVKLWLGMILPKGKPALLEAVNVIVAERYAYIDKVDAAYDRTLACPNLREGVATEKRIKYKDITLASIAPLFAVVALVLVCAMIALGVELFMESWNFLGDVRNGSKRQSQHHHHSMPSTAVVNAQIAIDRLNVFELEIMRNRIITMLYR